MNENTPYKKVTMTLTDDEYNWLVNFAKSRFLSVSAAARMALIKFRQGDQLPPPIFMEADDEPKE